MQREPVGAHGPDAAAESIDGAGVAPDVGVVMNDRSVRAVDLPGTERTGLESSVEQIEER